MTLTGFPHSDIPGSMRAYRSPRLIVAGHVLRRLSAPRHPPSTLNNLTIKCLEFIHTRFAAHRLGIDTLASRSQLLKPIFSCQRTVDHEDQ